MPPSRPPGSDPYEAQVLQALDQLDAEKLGPCEATCRRVLAKAPTHPHALRVLANALFLQGKGPAAMHYALQAEKHAPPGDAMFLWVLGRLLRGFGPGDDVARVFAKGVAIDPHHVDLQIGLTENLLSQNKFLEAARAAERGIPHVPHSADLRLNFIVALMNLGRAEEASRLADDLIEGAPGYAPALLLRSAGQLYAQTQPPTTPRRDAERYWSMLAEEATPLAPAQGRAVPRPHAPVRVAFLSPDLREHSVSYFIEPLLRGLDRARIFVACYMSHTHTDDVTARLRPLANLWRDCGLMSDRAIAERVRADEIDVLIDLAGLTASHRMGVMAMRPAPVQATYLGYPGTTGLGAIGYRLVDTITDPAGDPYDAQEHCTESLLRMDPCFLCYRPPEGLPDVAMPPCMAGHAGHTQAPVTFGSFNALKKLTQATLELWTGAMRAVPGSRLVLKNSALSDASVRGMVLDRLERAGVEPDRVEVVGHTSTTREHLACYAKVDIALDTFPYHGTTTTCEALVMGVPVVSMTGRTHASRVGASVLGAAGCSQWLAQSPGEFARVAADLANDRAALMEARKTLRARVLASTLCDEAGMCRRFERAVLAMVWDATPQDGMPRA